MNELVNKKISLPTAALISVIVAILSAAVTWGKNSNEIENLQIEQQRQSIIISAHEKAIISMQVQLVDQYANIIWRLDRIEKKVESK